MAVAKQERERNLLMKLMHTSHCSPGPVLSSEGVSVQNGQALQGAAKSTVSISICLRGVYTRTEPTIKLNTTGQRKSEKQKM